MRHLKDLDHLRRRCKYHDLRVQELPYGVSIPCPFDCGAHVIIRYEALRGVWTDTYGCNGCAASFEEITAVLLDAGDRRFA